MLSLISETNIRTKMFFLLMCDVLACTIIGQDYIDKSKSL